MFFLKTLLLGTGIFVAASSAGLAALPDGKIHLTYWEKWSGAEEYAMQAVVDQFNHSQDKIVVDFLSVGEIEQKTIMATAGGDPPDISGVYLSNVYAFVDRDALTPLDDFIREDGSTPDQFTSRYAKAFASMGSYKGKIWAVPSTPTTIALFWNKDLFRVAGLDPEKPPRTLAEMEAMSAKLTVHDSAGNLRQVGFLPQASGGSLWAFPQWFGGQLFDGKNITVGTDPANLRAVRWIGDFSKQYGLENVRRLSSTFGSLASPQDPFMNGQVAMILDGVWRTFYINQFAPGLNYGVAGWPAAQPGINDFTIADADMLVIPRGAKHPKEAWEFLRYVSSPNLSAQRQEDLSGVELLCYLQEKGSPLQQWSPFFESHHPSRDIKIFRELGQSSHAILPPKMGILEQYRGELANAIDEVRLEIKSPEQALQDCQVRSQASWAWFCESEARRQKQMAAAATEKKIDSFQLDFSFTMNVQVRKTLLGLAFCLPWIIGLSVFTLYPVAASLFYSFCDYSVLQPAIWTGSENYNHLFHDELFWISLKNTFIYAVFSLPLGMVVALCLALLLNCQVRGTSLFRTIFYLPSIVPVIASSMLWLWIFNPTFGLLNWAIAPIFHLFGADAPGWLADPAWAKPALILMSAWGVGNSMIIYLAGLQDVPEALYESAEIDGANKWQQFWHVTLPMMMPVIYFNLIMGIIGSLQVFTQVYVMTGGTDGQPARSTLLYATYLFSTAFYDLRMGYASAMAWVLFCIIAFLTFLATKALKSNIDNVK